MVIILLLGIIIMYHDGRRKRVKKLLYSTLDGDEDWMLRHD